MRKDGREREEETTLCSIFLHINPHLQSEPENHSLVFGGLRTLRAHTAEKCDPSTLCTTLHPTYPLPPKAHLCTRSLLIHHTARTTPIASQTLDHVASLVPLVTVHLTICIEFVMTFGTARILPAMGSTLCTVHAWYIMVPFSISSRRDPCTFCD